MHGTWNSVVAINTTKWFASHFSKTRRHETEAAKSLKTTFHFSKHTLQKEVMKQIFSQKSCKVEKLQSKKCKHGEMKLAPDNDQKQWELW